MVATGMSEREEGMGGGGMRFGGQKSRLLHTHTHACTGAHTPFQALSSARTQGRLQSQARPVSSGMKPRTEPLRRRETGRRVGKRGNHSRELSRATDIGKRTLYGYQGWEPPGASRQCCSHPGEKVGVRGARRR